MVAVNVENSSLQKCIKYPLTNIIYIRLAVY